MTETEDERRAREAKRREAVRSYAAGTMTWADLKAIGVRRYTQVLADLADMQLQVPIAPLDGKNAEIRRAGISRLEKALRAS